MRIIVQNLSDESLFCHGGATGSVVLLPKSSSPMIVKRGRLSLARAASEKTAGASVSIPLTDIPLLRKWRAPPDCPWRIYRTRHRLGPHTLVVLPARDLSSFLSDIPDSVPLSALLLPGTHDTMAFYGWPVSQCQSPDMPLARQLRAGVRVLDIRLALVRGVLTAYHGIYPQRAPFAAILATLHAFLAGPGARDTLVVSIKQEDFALTSVPAFSAAVHAALAAAPGGLARWFLADRVPALGEVRGRAVLFSRFGGDGAGWEGGRAGLGIHPTTWPDSAPDGFAWDCAGTRVRTHDWYRIPSFLAIPEKAARALAVLRPPAAPRAWRAPPTLALAYLSAASPLAPPPTVARGLGWPRWGLGFAGVNERAAAWVAGQLAAGTRLRGWVLADYVGEPEELLALLVEGNFIGRRAGEEGW